MSETCCDYSDGMKLGIVSDMHGLLRPKVIPKLEGVERILHLGDVLRDHLHPHAVGGGIVRDDG